MSQASRQTLLMSVSDLDEFGVGVKCGEKVSKRSVV